MIDNFEQDTINVMFQILAFFLDYCYPQHYQYWRAEREEAQQKEGKIMLLKIPSDDLSFTTLIYGMKSFRVKYLCDTIKRFHIDSNIKSAQV